MWPWNWPASFRVSLSDESHALLIEFAGIADLATQFGIERACVEDDDGIVAGGDGLDGTTVLQQRQHFQPARGQRVVAEELRRCRCATIRRQLGAATELAGGTRGFLLLGHRGIEAGDVHRHPTFAGHVLGQVDGKP